MAGQHYPIHLTARITKRVTIIESLPQPDLAGFCENNFHYPGYRLAYSCMIVSQDFVGANLFISRSALQTDLVLTVLY